MTDPSECDHGPFDCMGEVDDEGDTLYQDGFCTSCGASVAAVHILSHFLVFEDPKTEPVEVDA